MKVLEYCFAALLFLANPALAAPGCEATQQLAIDGLVKRLTLAAQNPVRFARNDRACFVAASSQILGRYPGGLKDLSPADDDRLRNAIEKAAGPGSSDGLNELRTYASLATDLGTQCPSATQSVDPATLTASAASVCGLVAMPGAPAGLGRLTAEAEGGALEGGYASISGDPGAGGWTYGRYQLASKEGIKGFMEALQCPPGHKEACLPDDFRPLGDRLAQAGGVAAAVKGTPAFEQTWRDLALNDRTMQQAQESYQALKYWKPAVSYFHDALGIELLNMSCGLREAVFSIQTQHKWPSAKKIYAAGVRTGGTTDSGAIIKAANKWRLNVLGKPKGFYATYGNVCIGGETPKGYTREFACQYLNGVKKRWLHESEALPLLKEVACP